jgi:replicative DNA helicase
MSEISEAPLFVDDSPNMTMMEIRAKARRLKQRHSLRLIVVDYMQLMTSGKRVESRQQEVSEFSRQLKLLAKELEVPVVTISQLNRGPEQRTDKKPMLGDLRESGCLTAKTRILRADTGAEVTMAELLASGETNVPVWSFDHRLRPVARPMSAVFCSGVKEVLRLRLASGRVLEATANHPLLTVDGWVPLGALGVGDKLAVPREIPQPLDPRPMPGPEIVLLAQMIGDGSFVGLRPIPARVFGLPNEQLMLFLRHLWANGGSVNWDERAGQARLRYSSTSRRLVDDVAQLLLRAGVLARIRRIVKPGHRDCWQLYIHGAANQLKFLDEIGVLGARGVAAAYAANKLRGVLGHSNLDTVPREVWQRVRNLLAAPEIAHREVAAHAPSRSRLGRVAAVLDDADLDMLAVNGVLWDEIAEITSLGEQPVYDATVPGTHNFIANGVAVHNSLEQDADLVLLIHRPDAFERDDPRAGEADLIIAKHRNGPTATITVTNQLHLSRFANFARV